MTQPSFPPRLLSGTDAASYCGITLNTWSKWVAAGLMPKPAIGRRWDKKAIDLALDKASGLVAASSVPEEDPVTAWERGYEARKAAPAGADYPRQRYRWEDETTSTQHGQIT